MNYVALIADIRQSKGLADRRATQQRLRAACEARNAQGGALGLVSPATVTLGDEFQALFDGAAGLWRFVFGIEAQMKPVRLRYGIGVGAIETELNRASSVGMDGPAFHRARQAVETLKRDGGSYRVLGLADGQTLARHALDLVSRQRDRWKANRVDILSFLFDGREVAGMADDLGISEQAVYKNIREGGLEAIRGICEGVSELIEQSLAHGDGAAE